MFGAWRVIVNDIADIYSIAKSFLCFYKLKKISIALDSKWGTTCQWSMVVCDKKERNNICIKSDLNNMKLMIRPYMSDSKNDLNSIIILSRKLLNKRKLLKYL